MNGEAAAQGSTHPVKRLDTRGWGLGLPCRTQSGSQGSRAWWGWGRAARGSRLDLGPHEQAQAAGGDPRVGRYVLSGSQNVFKNYY